MNESDMKLCEEVADLWQPKSGDAEGFLWCWGVIYKILQEREEAAPAEGKEVDHA